MPPAFNSWSEATLNAGTIIRADRLGLVRGLSSATACGALSCASWHWRAQLAEVLYLTTLEGLVWEGALVEYVLGMGGAAYFGMLTLRYLGRLWPQQKPPQWAKELRPEQRALLGLSPAAPQRAGAKPAAAPDQAATPPAAARTPPSLGRPLRPVKPVASPLTPPPQQQLLQTLNSRPVKPVASPLTPPQQQLLQQLNGEERGKRTGSPASLGGPGGSRFGPARVVTTPEQLQRYMDSFEAGTGGPPSPERGAYGAFTGAGYGYGPPEGSPLGYGGAPAAAAHGGEAPAVPRYRPSLQARGKAGSPHRSDGRPPSASGEEALEAVLGRLQTHRRVLEVWTAQLRAWLAAELLQPLAAALARAQRDVVSTTAELGWSGLQLAPLDNDAGGGGSDGAKPGAGGARLGGGVTASGGQPGSGPEGDDALVLGQLREALTQRLRQAPGSPQLLACLTAIGRYQALAALARGEAPRGFLLPSPRGYLAQRVRQLADGPVVRAFQWQGGGEWAGKPWSEELPTDSALVLFLFSAFLAAPKWEFPLEETHAGAGGGNAPPSPEGHLYLGALPARPPANCAAILAYRPAVLPPGMSGILGTGLGGREPHFTLVLGGEAALTLCHHNAAFHAILLFLQNAKLSGGGAVGDRSLDYLKLSGVLKPGEPLHSIFAGRWFGLW